jgi:hypothetical protein
MRTLDADACARCALAFVRDHRVLVAAVAADLSARTSPARKPANAASPSAARQRSFGAATRSNVAASRRATTFELH